MKNTKDMFAQNKGHRWKVEEYMRDVTDSNV